jgi:hypothetical protein
LILDFPFLKYSSINFNYDFEFSKNNNKRNKYTNKNNIEIYKNISDDFNDKVINIISNCNSLDFKPKSFVEKLSKIETLKKYINGITFSQVRNSKNLLCYNKEQLLHFIDYVKNELSTMLDSLRTIKDNDVFNKLFSIIRYNALKIDTYFTYKTEFCTKTHCPYGNFCFYAHQISELKEKPFNKDYRTVFCKNFQNGYCPYGLRCKFKHEYLEDKNSNNENLKEKNLKENNLKENNLKENNLRENDLKMNNFEKNILRGNGFEINNYKKNNLKENNLKENNLKENNYINIKINISTNKENVSIKKEKTKLGKNVKQY